MTRPILLVHGAFHTGECWSRFSPKLTERGFEVHTLTLGGHAGNPRDPKSVSMETYGDDVIAKAEEIGRPCILLGHSMGGSVISGAAERRPELFESLIYLTAFVPFLAGANDPTAAPLVAPELLASFEPRPDGTIVIAPEAARKVFYNRCTPEDQDFALQGLCPQPAGAMSGGSALQATESGLGRVTKYYIECLDDAALTIAGQRALHARMPFAGLRSLDTDHSPFLSTPDELAEAIVSLVGR
jgi:pimeloyl-ACP methyl ester carboxylesterase